MAETSWGCQVVWYLLSRRSTGENLAFALSFFGESRASSGASRSLELNLILPRLQLTDLLLSPRRNDPRKTPGLSNDPISFSESAQRCYECEMSAESMVAAYHLRSDNERGRLATQNGCKGDWYESPLWKADFGAEVSEKIWAYREERSDATFAPSETHSFKYTNPIFLRTPHDHFLLPFSLKPVCSRKRHKTRYPKQHKVNLQLRISLALDFSLTEQHNSATESLMELIDIVPALSTAMPFGDLGRRVVNLSRIPPTKTKGCLGVQQSASSGPGGASQLDAGGRCWTQICD